MAKKKPKPQSDKPDACRECKRVFVKGKVSRRPRGLCAQCYNRPELRVAHGKLPGGYGNDKGMGGGGDKLPAHPTHHPPGSEGKILVMQQRAQRRETLFHPHDARLGELPPEDC